MLARIPALVVLVAAIAAGVTYFLPFRVEDQHWVRYVGGDDRDCNFGENSHCDPGTKTEGHDYVDVTPFDLAGDIGIGCFAVLVGFAGAMAWRPTSRTRAIGTMIGAGLTTLAALPTMLEGAYPSRPAPAGVAFNVAIAVIDVGAVIALIAAYRRPRAS